MKRSGRAKGIEQALQHARRELEKGNAKSALKEAKVCFRLDPGPESRTLLEQAYLARIEQLYTQRFIDEARAALSQLVALKPTQPEIGARLARLQVMLGEGGAQATQSLQDDPALLNQLTDDAVLDPRVRPTDATLAAQVQQVRAALHAVEREADEEALRLLDGIGRKSSLADWRFFVRGMVAFYRDDAQQVDENWRRLDPARPASRIAATLRAATSDMKSADVPPEVLARVRRLQQSPESAPILTLLTRFSEHIREKAWERFVSDLRTLQQRFGQSHPDVVERVVEIGWRQAVHDVDARFLGELIRYAKPPQLDPSWNRARALLVERHEESEFDDVVGTWKAYAEDLGRLACLSEQERPIARALVYQHLAQELVTQARIVRDDETIIGEDEDEEDEQRSESALEIELLNEAERCYRQAISSYAELHSAYIELAKLHQQRGDATKSAVVLERLVRVAPDCVMQRMWLARYYLSRDQLDHSAVHVEAVRRLKPRARETAILHWDQLIYTVHANVRKRKFDDAREALGEANQHPPPGLEPFRVHVLRAALELKAKNQEVGQQSIDAALAACEDHAPVWLYLASLAVKYNLPAPVKKEFNEQYKKLLQRKLTPRAAGGLARAFLDFRSHQFKYTGRATQERLFVKGIGAMRTVRFAEWAEGDVVDVCRLLADMPRTRPVRSWLVPRAVKRFTENAWLHLLAGEAELECGPWACHLPTASSHLRKALFLANAATGTKEPEIIERAQKALERCVRAHPFFGAPWEW